MTMASETKILTKLEQQLLDALREIMRNAKIAVGQYDPSNRFALEVTRAPQARIAIAKAEIKEREENATTSDNS